LTVLVVDDSAEIRARLREMLAPLPGVLRIDTVGSALEARRAIALQPPDIVVLDIHMPVGSGLDVLEALQRSPTHVTTIVLTNDPSPQWRRNCLQAGADFFFDKSVEFQRTIDVVAGLARAAAPAHGNATRSPTATEEALRASEQRYDDLCENATDAIFTTDVDLNFTSVNGAAATLLGYSRDEAKRLNVAAIVTPDTLEMVRHKLEEQRNGKPASMYETEILTRDGRRVPIEVTARLVYREGRPVGTQGIARDISERKRLEQELRQAQKMEAIGRLAGGIAHDFNNLLTVIMGHSQEMIERLPPDDPSRADALQILGAGEFAAGLTRQLLAFSRQQIIAPQVLDFNAVVAGLTPMLRRVIEENVNLDIRIGPERYAMKADPGQIEQVLMNLVVNARDAMPHGGTLTIETTGALIEAPAVVDRSFMALGRYVLLVVRDTGQGMDGETKAHLFEPFFTTKDAGRGTGLGLSTVYGIVKQNGGYVFVDSEPACGTTFRLYFPRLPVAEIAPAPAARSPRRTTGGSERILLVDDDLGVRNFAARVLSSRGYAVLSASSPDEAVELSEEQEGRIDLLLTDVVMPGTTGRALANIMRESTPGLKVLYMSGYTTEAIVDHGILDPAIAFIGKPFTAERLALKVRETLDGTGTGGIGSL
jgi:two-component system, cell cycle sensor histidine kinase and response regulator CckA